MIKQKKTITLVQTVADIFEYHEMRENNQLPLVLNLSDYEMEFLFDGRPSKPISIKNLYRPSYMSNKKNMNYLFLNSDSLRELIEHGKIFIPDFIASDGEVKYVDYVSESYSVDSGDLLVFRDSKRIFSSNQKKCSLKKNRVTITPMEMRISNISGTVPMFLTPGHSADSEELFILCTQAVYDTQEKNKQKQKSISE